MAFLYDLDQNNSRVPSPDRGHGGAAYTPDLTDEVAFNATIDDLKYVIHRIDLCELEECNDGHDIPHPSVEQLELFRRALAEHGASESLLSTYEGDPCGLEIIMNE